MALQRFLVRRTNKDVFIWTEDASHIAGIVEVYAETADEALRKVLAPEPDTVVKKVKRVVRALTKKKPKKPAKSTKRRR